MRCSVNAILVLSGSKQFGLIFSHMVESKYIFYEIHVPQIFLFLNIHILLLSFFACMHFSIIKLISNMVTQFHGTLYDLLAKSYFLIVPITVVLHIITFINLQLITFCETRTMLSRIDKRAQCVSVGNISNIKGLNITEEETSTMDFYYG